MRLQGINLIKDIRCPKTAAVPFGTDDKRSWRTQNAIAVVPRMFES